MMGANVPVAVVPRDANGVPVSTTFLHVGGAAGSVDSLQFAIDADTLNWQTVVLPGMSGYFNFQFSEDANATSARFCFRELQSKTDTSYAWGDTFSYWIDGNYRRDAFQIGAATHARIAVVGAEANPDSKIEFFWWVEGN